MESAMPVVLREESKRLLNIWYYSTEDVSFNDFIERHGSNELKQYRIEAKARDAEYRAQGVIVN